MRKLSVGLLFLVLAIFPQLASADTLTFDGVKFDLSTSGNTITLTVTDAGCAAHFGVSQCYLGNVAVKTFASFTGFSGSSTQPGTYASAALGNLGGGSCGGQGNGFVCFGTTSGVLLTGQGSYTFTVTVTNPGALSTFHVQADLASGSPIVLTGRNNNKLDQISQDVTGSAPVPEPASFIMLGSGLSAIALRFRKK